MNKNKRQFFKNAATVGLGAVLLSSTNNAFASSAGNQLLVGENGDYPDISSALDAIENNSEYNPYQIFVLPGTYGGFDCKEYVDIIGSGQKSSFIETSFLQGDYIRLCSNMVLSNFGIRYSGTIGSGTIRGAVQKMPGIVSEVILSNVEFEVSGITGCSQPKYAINFGGKVNLTAYNLRIKTEAGGIRLSDGNSRWHNCDIYLTGNQTGLPRYGIVMESGNRLDWYGGRIGTGYYYDQDIEDPDQDVIGLYIPSSNTGGNARAEIHDAEMFARNVAPSSNAKINAVRAENGWVRLYGCYCQTEINPDVYNNGSKSLYAAKRTDNEPLDGSGGIIEAYGCRVRSLEGYVVGGAGVQGYFNYNTSDDHKIILRYENLCLCDAGSGAFTLRLANDSPTTSGDEHIFKKIDDTDNEIIIHGNGSKIDGSDYKVLSEQYMVIRVRRIENEWMVI
ncbi:hypothetical protein [uncultured Desulfobacter sp.]|uniref:hypothetical protein n=1 Tax=uncultured Desulfobacter sp. TaxID=240139 RepID=UPI0029F5A0FF|nr:hypothetical protein [uncultured Desulfobacter sp.]